MRHQNRWTLAVLVAVGAAACSDPTEVSGPHLAPEGLVPVSAQQRTTVQVPMRGYWVNTEDPPSDYGDCVLYFTTSQVGRSTHLGEFTGTGETCIPRPPEFLGEPPPGHEFAVPSPPYFVAPFRNRMTWTAANGDQLWLRPNQGVFVQSSAGDVSVIGTLRISGGTGRFSGASGAVDVRNTDPSGTRMAFEGVIRLRPGGCAAREGRMDRQVDRRCSEPRQRR